MLYRKTRLDQVWNQEKMKQVVIENPFLNSPFEKLQRTLRAEIDESAWAALYSTTSYPFEKPKNGKIAVKVINHYGDEVLKVYDV
jgi:hypothetical protein